MSAWCIPSLRVLTSIIVLEKLSLTTLYKVVTSPLLHPPLTLISCTFFMFFTHLPRNLSSLMPRTLFSLVLYLQTLIILANLPRAHLLIGDMLLKFIQSLVQSYEPPYLMEMPKSLEVKGQKTRTGIKGVGGGRQPAEKLQRSSLRGRGPLALVITV